jgi:spore coat polysaccharide biosynthesis protein SpsF
MSVDAILRARMASTRLPGKTLLRAAGKTMLEHTLERIDRSTTIDRVVVATTEEPDDDAIAELCEALGTPCFRGSSADVLGRVHACADEQGMRDVAHFGADNPLIDPEICDQVIGAYLEDGWDYVTNNFPPTFPDGEEVEVTSFTVLARLAREATEPRQREHMLAYIWEHSDEFRVLNVTREPNLHHLRWTLDEPEDWELIRDVFDALYPENPAFGARDVGAFLDRRRVLQ